LIHIGYHHTPREYFEDYPKLTKSVRSFDKIGFPNERTTPKLQPHGQTSLSLTPLPKFHHSVMRVHFYIPVSLGGGGDGGNTTIALSSFISSLIIRAEDTAMGREEHRSKGKNERYKSIRQEGEGWR